MDIDDEADYPNDVLLSEKFLHYQGLKNLKDGQWNPRANLPDYYNHIFTFASFQQTQKTAHQQNQQQALVYPGMYVRLTLKGISP